MNLLMEAFYIFFTVLEAILFLYIIASWFPISSRLRGMFAFVLDPILEPVRFLLRRSIFGTSRVDISPMIGLVVIIYLQEIFQSLLNNGGL